MLITFFSRGLESIKSVITIGSIVKIKVIVFIKTFVGGGDYSFFVSLWSCDRLLSGLAKVL
jgi:hypothetical protein